MAAEYTLLQRFERAGPRTWLLASLAAWALLLWLGALLGMGGHLRATPVLPAEPLPQPTAIEPARIGPLGQYAEAASRPLFTEDRRPRSFMATGPEGTEAVQSQTLDFILTGVLISPQVQLAILQPTGGGQPQRVRVGKSPEGVSGWELLSLEPRRAFFQGSGGQVTLDLRTYGDTGRNGGQGSPPLILDTPPPGMQGSPVRSDPAAVAATAAAAAASAASAAADSAAAAPQTDQARIEAIRKRIEARRAQQRAAGQTGGSSEPQKP